MQDFLKIRGAKVNNLKNIDLDIPLNKITCFFGPSGSGKTSIAFHTLYAESKRRFLNSYPNYLKFFSDRPAPVDVDEIFPVLPVFGLPQINPVVGARSNVADIMHLTELFQNQFYHYSRELCQNHKKEFVQYEFSDYIAGQLTGDDKEIYHLFIKADDFIEYFESSPFPTRSIKSNRARTVVDFDKDHQFWEVLRFKPNKLENLNAKVEEYLKKRITVYLYSKGLNKLIELKFSSGVFKCSVAGCEESSLALKSPMHFSPYNALGACDKCGGFGETLDYDEEKLVDIEKSVFENGVLLLNYKTFDTQKEELKRELKKKKISIKEPIKNLKKEFWDILYEGSGTYPGFNEFFKYLERKKYKMHVRIFIRNIQKGALCTDCNGTRLSSNSNQFFVERKFHKSLAQIMSLSVDEVLIFLDNSKTSLYNDSKESIKSLKKLIEILQVATNIGLGHLSLLRKAKTVSAGEYQRLLLLKYLSYEGTGALFVFDEPSLGLNVAEMKSLMVGFNQLIKNKNTVIIIDHNLYFRESSDYLIEMGPGAGFRGGEVLFAGKKSEYNFIPFKNELKPLKSKSSKVLFINGIEIYGKKFQDISLKLNEITWVVGSSGTGKTSVIINTLAAQLHYLKESKHLNIVRGSFDSLKGNPDFNDIVIVDANLTRYTSRSTVGSMTGLFPVVRKHFLNNSVAKSLGLKDGHLSYNSDLGQCPKCEGRGVTVVEMQFLEDISLVCEDCGGKKLKPLYSEISDGVMTVHEAFSKPVGEVLSEIKLTPKFQRISEYLKILNLDYLSLDRTINSLSGGEKQRIYLLNKLQKNISNSIIFFENISFGLSIYELIRLCEFLQNLSQKDNTIVIIDQDLNFKQIASNTISFD